MSIKRMTATWEQSKSKGANLLLLLAIADFARDNGLAWPSMKTLATKTKVCRRTIIRQIEQCEDIGDLFVLRRRNQGNRYLLLPGLSDEQITDTLTGLFEWLQKSISDILSYKGMRDVSINLVKRHMSHLLSDIDPDISDTAMSHDPLFQSVIDPLLAGEKTSPAPPEKSPEHETPDTIFVTCPKCGGRATISLNDKKKIICPTCEQSVTFSGEENPPREETETAREEPSVLIENEEPVPPRDIFALARETEAAQKRLGSDLKFESAIRAFCDLIPAFDFELLDKGMRKQWNRAMEAHAKRFGLEPGQLAEGIGKIPADESKWEIENVWKRGPYPKSLGEMAAAARAIVGGNGNAVVMPT